MVSLFIGFTPPLKRAYPPIYTPQPTHFTPKTRNKWGVGGIMGGRLRPPMLSPPWGLQSMERPE